jgi:hypothetical protein
MRQMLASRAVMIQIIAAASVTGVFATPFPEVAQAQGNSTSPAPYLIPKVLLFQKVQQQLALLILIF